MHTIPFHQTYHSTSLQFSLPFLYRSKLKSLLLIPSVDEAVGVAEVEEGGEETIKSPVAVGGELMTSQ